MLDLNNELIDLVYPQGSYTFEVIDCSGCGSFEPCIIYRNMDGYLNRPMCKKCLAEMIAIIEENS